MATKIDAKVCEQLEALHAQLLVEHDVVQTCKINQRLTALFFDNGEINPKRFHNLPRKLLRRLCIAAGCLRVDATVPAYRDRAELERLAVVAGYVEIYANHYAQR